MVGATRFDGTAAFATDTYTTIYFQNTGWDDSQIIPGVPVLQ